MGTIVQEAAISALIQLSGDVSGLQICDLACGQGIMAQNLSRRGARVIGVDLSVRLLAIARAHEIVAQQGIRYMEMNAETLSDFATASLHGVVCNLALMDIEDIEAASTSVYRVLRPGGWFAFSIMHPCFQTPDSSWASALEQPGRLVRAYFHEGRWYSKNRTGVRGQVGAIHRTLGTYFNALTGAGFILRGLIEPRLDREPGKTEPAYDVVPAVLAARFEKAIVS